MFISPKMLNLEGQRFIKNCSFRPQKSAKPSFSDIFLLYLAHICATQKNSNLTKTGRNFAANGHSCCKSGVTRANWLILQKQFSTILSSPAGRLSAASEQPSRMAPTIRSCHEVQGSYIGNNCFSHLCE